MISVRAIPNFQSERIVRPHALPTAKLPKAHRIFSMLFFIVLLLAHVRMLLATVPVLMDLGIGCVGYW